jgi:hypothetical protein
MAGEAQQNHYDVLGLDRTASAEDVRSAYRLRSHMFHPDKYENYAEPLRTQLKAEAAKEFKKLTAAYAVLRDPAKRAAHDHQLSVGYAASSRPTRSGTVRAATTRAHHAPSRGPSRATVREVHPGETEEEAARPRRARRPAAPQPPRPRERDPLLVVRPDRLDFGTMGVGATKQLPLKIANAGGRTLFGEITSNRAWLSVNRRSFISSSALLFVSADTTGLQPGEEYAGSLVVSTLNGGDQVVPVAMRVSGRPEPILAGVPSLLDFGLAQPGSVKARTVRLTNGGTGTLIGSVAVKGAWLAVSENHFRGNDVSFEVIATTTSLLPGEHQGELVLFSNGGQATVQVVIEIPKLAPGGAIVRPAVEPSAGEDAEQPAAEPPTAEAPTAEAASERETGPAPTGEAQRQLIKRITQIEPETVWERDFLRRIVQLVRAGEKLAPGELAKIYEMEARLPVSQDDRR